MTIRPVRLVALSVAILGFLFLPGCASVSTRVVFEEKQTKVKLRSSRGDDLGFSHPAMISSARISHILSRIDVRKQAKDGSVRAPAIPLDTLNIISDGVAIALAKAQSNEEVVVYSIRRDKRFGIFDQNYLTSFITYVKNNMLYIHLSRTDWNIPERRDGNLPDPEIGEFPRNFRVLTGKAMGRVDKQSVAVDWRNTIFNLPTRVRITPDGKAVRRTILMESEEVEEQSAPGPAPADVIAIPPNISANTLRALADLEDQRQNGEISENQYDRRRSEILAVDTINP